ncbi:MAG: polyprenyl synthetase family protein, partial [Oscillospiraceae bacterium]|nr:polyprenyl synthetase family protein [Oscillospiraceae bacterium]
TNHKVFGETMAILAGDALQSEAFGLIAAAELSAQSRIDAVQILAKAAGADGMVAGQVLDTVCRVDDEDELTLLHLLKTGAMIAGAAELGCAAAEMSEEKRAQAVEFATQLGLAFQIRDDMLDVVGDEQVLGKPIGSDAEEGKMTFVDLKGLEGCAKLVDECTARAKAALADWADNEFLLELADRMVGRNN